MFSLYSHVTCRNFCLNLFVLCILYFHKKCEWKKLTILEKYFINLIALLLLTLNVSCTTVMFVFLCNCHELKHHTFLLYFSQSAFRCCLVHCYQDILLYNVRNHFPVIVHTCNCDYMSHRLQIFFIRIFL